MLSVPKVGQTWLLLRAGSVDIGLGDRVKRRYVIWPTRVRHSFSFFFLVARCCYNTKSHVENNFRNSKFEENIVITS